MENEKALEILLKICEESPKTVIDHNWEDYLKDTETLEAILTIAKLPNYRKVLKFYEGYTIEELINKK